MLPYMFLVFVTSCHAINTSGTIGFSSVTDFIRDLTEKINQYEKTVPALSLEKDSCEIEGKLVGFNKEDAKRMYTQPFGIHYSSDSRDYETVDISFTNVYLVFGRFADKKAGKGFMKCESASSRVISGLTREDCKVRLVPTMMTFSFAFVGTVGFMDRCSLKKGVRRSDDLQPTRVFREHCPVNNKEWSKLQSMLMDNKQKVLEYMTAVEDAVFSLVKESMKNKIPACKLDQQTTTHVLPASQDGKSNV